MRDNADYNKIYVIGGTHETVNVSILLASLEKQVFVLGHSCEIERTLTHYNFDRQMNALWSLYINEGKIITQEFNPDFSQITTKNPVIWLFINELNASQLENFIHYQTNPHAHVIISGFKEIGEIEHFATRLKTSWVYYLPFTFMKDGANFSKFFSPDLLMIGEKTIGSIEASSILLFLKNQAKICEVAPIKTIEFARSSVMAMLATRLSFMNEMARLADNENINIKDIERIMGQDNRIGSAYLSAGWGFGGRTLPNELNLLEELFEKSQVGSPILDAVININEDQKELIFRKFWQYFDGFIEHKTVLIWGAGYRIGAGITINSAIHPLLRLLWSYQIKTIIYTNHTAFELQSQYHDQPLLSTTKQPYEHLSQADSLFIINWSSPFKPDIHELNKINIPIFDAKNILTDEQVALYQGKYFGIGRCKK